MPITRVQSAATASPKTSDRRLGDLGPGAPGNDRATGPTAMATLTPEQQAEALRRIQSQADARAKLGARFFQAAEARTSHYRQLADELRADLAHQVEAILERVDAAREAQIEAAAEHQSALEARLEGRLEQVARRVEAAATRVEERYRALAEEIEAHRKAMQEQIEGLASEVRQNADDMPAGQTATSALAAEIRRLAQRVDAMSNQDADDQAPPSPDREQPGSTREAQAQTQAQPVVTARRLSALPRPTLPKPVVIARPDAKPVAKPTISHTTSAPLKPGVAGPMNPPQSRPEPAAAPQRIPPAKPAATLTQARERLRARAAELTAEPTPANEPPVSDIYRQALARLKSEAQARDEAA